MKNECLSLKIYAFCLFFLLTVVFCGTGYALAPPGLDVTEQRNTDQPGRKKVAKRPAAREAIHPGEAVQMKHSHFVLDTDYVPVVKGARGHIFLQLASPLKEEHRNELSALGVKLLQYIPRNTWKIVIPAGKIAAVKRLSYVRAMGNIHSVDKFPVSILDKNFHARSVNPDGTLTIEVYFYKDVGFAGATAMINGLGVATAQSAFFTGSRITVTISRNKILALSRLDIVKWIENKEPPKTTDNANAAKLHNVDNLLGGSYNLTGSGVAIGEWDVGEVQADHPDLTGRVTNVETSSVSDHSTHVAGTMIGSGAGNANAKGMAPSATLYSYNYAGDELAEMVSAEGTYGIVLSNNSYGRRTGWSYSSGYGKWLWYGDSDFGDYTQTTANWDQTVIDTNLIIVKSAGNHRAESGDTTQSGHYHSPDYSTVYTDLHDPDGDYDCIGQIGVAKNIITVGAVMDDVPAAMFSISSWGPADDGRVKPDIVANGTLYSTYPTDTYAIVNGTSMSAPVVTGALALIIEEFKVRNGGSVPSPHLARALITNTAVDLFPTGPDYMFGWGLLDAQAAVDTIIADNGASSNIKTGSVANGVTDTYNFSVSASQAVFKVTLAWTDPAASAGAEPALVNNLDLTLTSPGSTVYYPWSLGGISDPSAAATATGANTVDNIEQVFVSSPASGSWSIKVKGTTVPDGPQSYALVINELFSVNAAPTTSGISDVNVDEDASSTVIDLYPAFADAEDADSAMDIDYMNNTNPGLFSSYTIIGGGAYLNLTLNYAADANGTADITIRTTDTGYLYVETTFTVTVMAVNDVPVITEGASINVTMDEDGSPTPFSLTLNASDIDGDTITWSISGAASNGTATASGSGSSKSIGYTPTGNYNGSDSFVVQVSDGNGGTDTITVNVTVDAVNDAPVITEGASTNVTMDEDGSPTPFSLTLNVTDGEGDTITWSISGTASNGTATVSGSGSSKSIGYTPNTDFNGADSFVVQVSDGNGGTDTITVNVTVDAVSDAPTTTGIFDVTVAEDAINTNINLYDSFADAEDADSAMTYTIESNTNSGLFASANISSGMLTLDYAPVGTGTADITVRATDTGALNVETTFTVTVTPDNVLKLGGGGDRAQAATSIFPDTGTAQSFTVEAWIYPTANLKYIVTDDAFSSKLLYQSGAGIKFTLQSNCNNYASISEIRDITLNQWNHVALVFDASAQQYKISINGILSSSPGSFATGTFCSDPDEHFTVGGMYGNDIYTFEGYIDEVRVSDIVRYTSDFTPSDPFTSDANTRGLWHFNEAACSTSFADASGNGNTLTGLNGAQTQAEASTTPTTSGISGVTVSEDAVNTDINLYDSFADAEDVDADMIYTITNNTNTGLFTSTNISSGTLTLDYAPDASVNADITVRATDTGCLYVETAFTVTVTAVNDVPSFTKGSDQSVNEDAGTQSVSNWATSLSAGPSDESGQSLTFSVSNDNNSLFSTQPAISATGDLTYTPALDASGGTTVTISISDDGGTANSGVDTSADQTFTVTVAAVNDVPSFTKGSYQSVNEDAGAQSVSNWATSLSAGPSNESGQSLTFNVSNDNNSLFSTQPAILVTGDLTFTPASDANGSATVTVSISDDGGTANGGVDTSANQTFTITVVGGGVEACEYFISSEEETFASEGGRGSVDISTDDGCGWTATSNASWITITSGGSGSGNETVNYSVAYNTGDSSRTGTVTIAEQTFTVNQASTCTKPISPTSKSFGVDGGTDSISVSDPGSCGWTATSNASWITITSGDSGSGNGIVNYSVGSNTGDSSRTGTIMIEGETFTVIQAGTNPFPDIKANGFDGLITLGAGETLSVSISLTAGSGMGVNCDWWVAVNTPFASPNDWYHFDLSGWIPGLSFTHQGLLFDLTPPFKVLNMTGLPAGTYVFYFAVDTNMNGLLDPGDLYYDSVVVNITP